MTNLVPMLFKNEHLKRIKSGEITLAFRRWKKPSVNEGSLIKTAIGVIKIGKVEETTPNDITVEDAHHAGFSTLEALFKILNTREGNIYKIGVAYHSADPRIELREDDDLADEDFESIKASLQRLDKYSKEGEWTLEMLNLIYKHPKQKAQDLADKTGKEKEWLKLNVRKLKNLGLTISYHPGYTLSPRGIAFLKRINKKG